MADWYGACRTNYVQVKDPAAFEKEFAPFSVQAVYDEQGRVALLSTDEHGGWPSSVEDEETGEELEFDFGLAVPHLVEGQVLVVLCSGAEKLRYITGDAIAYSWDNRIVSVDINEIYAKVKTAFGVDTTLAEY